MENIKKIKTIHLERTKIYTKSKWNLLNNNCRKKNQKEGRRISHYCRQQNEAVQYDSKLLSDLKEN